jgi:hypothetical protein
VALLIPGHGLKVVKTDFLKVAQLFRQPGFHIPFHYFMKVNLLLNENKFFLYSSLFHSWIFGNYFILMQ